MCYYLFINYNYKVFGHKFSLYREDSSLFRLYFVQMTNRVNNNFACLADQIKLFLRCLIYT